MGFLGGHNQTQAAPPSAPPSYAGQDQLTGLQLAGMGPQGAPPSPAGGAMHPLLQSFLQGLQKGIQGQMGNGQMSISNGQAPYGPQNAGAGQGAPGGLIGMLIQHLAKQQQGGQAPTPPGQPGQYNFAPIPVPPQPTTPQGN